MLKLRFDRYIMTTRSNSYFSLDMQRDERRLKLRSKILFQTSNNVCVKLVIRFLKHDHVTIEPIFSLKKAMWYKQNKCELKLSQLTVTIGTFHDELS